MTIEERQRKSKDSNLPPENERFIRACSDIASFLVQEHESQQDPSKPKKDVNLNSLRSKMSKKHRLSNIPPLTAIIAAIPEHYKKYILPKLIAKPIRKYFQNCGRSQAKNIQGVLQVSLSLLLCANPIVVHTLHTLATSAYTALAAQTRILNTRHNRTLATNLPPCEQFEHDMIRSSRREAE